MSQVSVSPDAVLTQLVAQLSDLQIQLAIERARNIELEAELARRPPASLVTPAPAPAEDDDDEVMPMASEEVSIS